MHAAARHGMYELLKALLYENGGNPNKVNRRKQTVLHKVCEGSVDAVQYECMQLLLQWRDVGAASAPAPAAAVLTAAANRAHVNPAAATATDQHRNIIHNSLLLDINVNAKDDVMWHLSSFDGLQSIAFMRYCIQG